MRYVSLGFGIVFLAVSFSTVAADANQKDKDYAVSFGVGSGGGLSLKKALGKSTWIFANASVSANRSESQYTFNGTTINFNSTTRNYSLSTGVRQYLNNEKLSKFVQLSLAETYTKYSSGGSQSSAKSYGATAGYGLEYFFDTDLSVEGTLGLSYTYMPSSSVTQNISSRSMSFPVVGTAITYYW